MAASPSLLSEVGLIRGHSERHDGNWELKSGQCLNMPPVFPQQENDNVICVIKTDVANFISLLIFMTLKV